MTVGENCLNVFLAPGAWARSPLVNRLPELQVPVHFLYGDHDWMSSAGGKDVLDAMQGRAFCKMSIIKNAGHHVRVCCVSLCDALTSVQLYMDNPEDFNASVMEWISQLERGMKRV